MAIQINYLDDGIGIEIVASEIVTGDEIISAHEEIYNEENLKKQKYQIIDRTQCTEYRVSSEEVKKIAELDKAAAKSNPNIIIALVAPTTLQYGISRMWQAFVEESCFLTQIFRDRESADKWIEKQLGNPGR